MVVSSASEGDTRQNQPGWPTVRSTRTYLTVAGILSFLTALLHIAIIVGGPDWYRFFGAGEATAVLVEQGFIRPTITTGVLAVIFTGWGLYAWSGAGIVKRLPLLRTGLILIAFVYLARGVGGLIVPFFLNHPRINELSPEFMVWSSLISLGFGSVHLKGIIDGWAGWSRP